MNILKKIAKVISNIIFYILLIIILILLVYVIFIHVYKKQGRIGEVPINFYTILTTSMVPYIQAGDIIITYKDKNDLYEAGDVITFVSESSMSKGITITHRIKRKDVVNGIYYYYTQGDANNTEDSAPVSSSNVVGKVILIIPKAGYIQTFVSSKFGWLVVVVLPCLSIIIYDVIKIIEKMVKGRQKDILLSKENTKNQRTDLAKIIEEKNVSSDLQEKIDVVYSELGVENKNSSKEDDDIEVL